jgi:hypothetical protein
MRFGKNELTGAGFSESFRSSAIGFYLRHFLLSFFDIAWNWYFTGSAVCKFNTFWEMVKQAKKIDGAGNITIPWHATLSFC